ncbi:helix-turn-helix transcriptional regulator [Reinekea marinisedimentorum]|uniref:Cro/C1-type helix-turn-helix DNA-binding protein n=1 Tax=Reinekea marinisedimentorum TaxID=230495 RepID=A0A4R3IB63_9GAMM|nr:helix-turn-helix transcriptional regulator [Reinekea marinisedimentorum]TCS42690.1 Cro/C1-type helix-turn-helix DNA-binding protein [Reinekea marinisedimentorum]
MNEDFAQNLRLLCSYYKSITEVTNRLGISRPQFNRYLSGKHRPAAGTLRKICEFFDIEIHEIYLPHSQFQRIVQVRPQTPTVEPDSPIQQHLARLQQRSSPELDKYLGYYFEYYLSMAVPGKILRTLVCIERQGNGVFYQRTERLTEGSGEPICHCKYLGTAYMLNDRIFLQDYESLTANEITQTILYPTFTNRLSRLHGLRLGVSSNSERLPCCARIVFEYLGANVNLKKSLSFCRLYDFDSEEIDRSIRDAILNDCGTDGTHFRARQ